MHEQLVDGIICTNIISVYTASIKLTVMM